MAKTYHDEIKDAAKQLVDNTPIEFCTQRPLHWEARKVLEMQAAEGHSCEVIGAIVMEIEKIERYQEPDEYTERLRAEAR